LQNIYLSVGLSLKREKGLSLCRWWRRTEESARGLRTGSEQGAGKRSQKGSEARLVDSTRSGLGSWLLERACKRQATLSVKDEAVGSERNKNGEL
jgi:hypothetical protein